MLKLAPAAPLVALATLASPAAAQDYPMHVAAPGGEAVIPAAPYQRAWDEFHFAPARRAGDWLYISGVVAGPRPGEGHDVEAYKAQVRRAFRTIEGLLEAEGLTFADVTMINSFHVWEGPNFTGTKAQQFEAFSAVKDEFMPPPHPAWTAVGSTGLIAETGVTEIQMIAYAPQVSRR
ncbi:Rid family hydrolase [Phenylobacterium soli]|nr:Rid family hydrolase [Phenylobacterium soli]